MHELHSVIFLPNLPKAAAILFFLLLLYLPIYCADNNAVEEYISEPQFPQLHRCKDGGEVYSGAYLTTKEHLLWETFEPLNIVKFITC